MVEALGAKVLKLVRVKIGSIAIGALPIGKWRLLSGAEVSAFTPARVERKGRLKAARLRGHDGHA